MEKPKVSIAKLNAYDGEKIYQALQQNLQLLGGLKSLLQSKSKVFVKINHISPPSPPERGLITHPVFTKEVLRILKESGHRVTFGDDIQSKEDDGFLTSQYRQISQELNIPLINLKERGFREVECRGEFLKETLISQACLEADYIINLPKLKTHSFTLYTGAIKNMYGIIPYGFRLKYHRQYIKNDDFSQMLVDILSCLPPRLNIMDGIMAMEGEGPSAGNLKKVGVILASTDAVALDAVAAKIVGFNPMDVFTTFHAHNRGLGSGRIEDIEILGERIQDVQVKNFKHSAIALSLFRRRLPSFLYAYFQDQLISIPEVKKDQCAACLECLNVCPMQAVRLDDDLVWIDKKRCIHCLCCHEVCRYQAIKLKKRAVGRVVKRIFSTWERINALLS